MLDRGFTLAEFGIAAAAQSILVLLLELPTGGLADVIGARRVLLAANVADLASVGLLLVADSVPLLFLIWALQGVFRALESGPLDAWYVSAALQARSNPAGNRSIERPVDTEADMAKAGTTAGVAIAAGSLASSGLVLLAPSLGINPLLLPVVVAVGLRVVDIGAVVTLMTESVGGTVAGVGGLRASLRAVPPVIAGATRLIRGSVALAALLLIEVLWGVGLVGFEVLFPPRLAEVLEDPETAAGVLGPVGTAAWLLAAAGAALAPALSRRVGPAVAAAIMRIAQGATVLTLAVLGGPVLLVMAYLATMGLHGASNVVQVGILHANTGSAYRTTVLSANSMAAHLGGGLGSVGLGLLASGAVSAGPWWRPRPSWPRPHRCTC